MFLKIWNYIRGYVTISVKGFAVERFMNLAMNKGIFIWDVKYKNNNIQMNVSINGYKLLKPFAKKTKCEIKIINKYGYPFFAFKYRKRKILAFGILFFIISLYSLSSHIWLIDIIGYERVQYTEIRSFLYDNGLKIGKSKKKINTQDLQTKILNNFSDISWVSISLTGTMATIELKETLAPKSLIDKSIPCNIIADKDGLIDSIVVKNGEAKVKKGDVVKKGDILVSGEMNLKEDEFGVIKSYVHADADIFSKNYHDINFFVPYKYLEKSYTGKEKHNYKLSIYNKQINLLPKKIKYIEFTRDSNFEQLNLGEKYPLPFVIIKDTYKEFTNIEKNRSKEECSMLAEQILQNRIIHELAFNMNIVDKSMDISETIDGLDVKCKVNTVESIGVQTEIQDIDKINDSQPADNTLE